MPPFPLASLPADVDVDPAFDKRRVPTRDGRREDMMVMRMKRIDDDQMRPEMLGGHLIQAVLNTGAILEASCPCDLAMILRVTIKI